MTNNNKLLADRVRLMTESETLKMAQMARELRAQGLQIINLSLGEPDFDTPLNIRNAAKKALDEGFTRYTPVPGLPELRQAIARKFLRENRLNYSPDQIVVSNGAKQSIANVCQALLNPGDEVLIFAPYWVSYVPIVELTGAKPILISAGVATDYMPSAHDLEAAITERTRLLIFSSPCNPTGTVFTKEKLESYSQVLQKYPNIYIISDEIYEKIIFEAAHTSFASLPGMFDKTITVNGFSKSFAMTGWRLGYIGAPQWIATACSKIQGQFTSGANAFAQKAGIEALENSAEEIEAMRKAFHQRRDLVLKLMGDLKGIETNTPQGAFYVFADASYYFGKKYGESTVQNAEDLCDFLLNSAHVATVSGAAFGAPSCFRISYAASEEDLKEAIKRIANALESLK